MALVVAYAAVINRPRILVENDRRAFLGNVDAQLAAVIRERPVAGAAEGEDHRVHTRIEEIGRDLVEFHIVGKKTVGGHRLYHAASQGCHIRRGTGRSLGQERGEVLTRRRAGCVGIEVAGRNVEGFEVVVGQGSVCRKDVVELHVLGEGASLAVDIERVALDGKTLAGKADGAFYKVLTAVYGSVDDVAEHCLVGHYLVASILVDKQVVVHGRFFELRSDGVACREIEDHDVAFFDIAQSLEAAIAYRGMVEIRIDTEKLVMNQWEVNGGHGHTGAVDHLVDPQVVASKQRLFKRTRRYLVVLPDEGKHEVDEHEGIYDCIDPAHDGTCGLRLALLPPGEGYVAGDVDIEKQKLENSQPPGAHPHYPCQEYEADEAEAEPARGLYLFNSAFKIFAKSHSVFHNAQNYNKSTKGANICACRKFLLTL